MRGCFLCPLAKRRKIMQKKLTVAVIGCGAFGKKFVNLFKHHPNVEKVYVCDLIPEKAKAYSEMFDVEILPSFEEALAREDINCIANFTQRSYELGYAFKFMRIMLVILTAIFNLWGFIAGVLLIILLIATNRSVGGGRGYLYPLVPFNGKALYSLVFRKKKPDIGKG